MRWGLGAELGVTEEKRESSVKNDGELCQSAQLPQTEGRAPIERFDRGQETRRPKPELIFSTPYCIRN